MGKGSAPRPFTDRAVFEDNFDKIFGKKKSNAEHLTESVKDNQELYKQLSRIDVISQNGNTGDHYEYELHPSTGDVEKVFKDGTFKPNESQFDNIKND